MARLKPPPSQARFEAALGTELEVVASGGEARLRMRLAEVKQLRAPPGFEQFSALFIGPHDPVMPQGIHRFEEAGFGAADLFAVPVGRAAEGVQYEVCVSHEAPDAHG